MVMYEKYRQVNNKYNLVYNNLGYAQKILKEKENTIKIENNINNKNLIFANIIHKYKFQSIINYLIKNKTSQSYRSPPEIYQIEGHKKRKNLKRNFISSIKNYYINKKTNRLTKKIIFINNFDKKQMKKIFMCFIKGKKYLIEYFHELSVHRDIHTLHNLIINNKLIWLGIYIQILKILLYHVLFVKKLEKL